MTLVRAAAVLLVLFEGFSQAPQVPQAPPVVGTGAISGVVVSAGSSPQPIRRAVITLSASNSLNRGAITDDNGQFTIASLPAGRYSLWVSKPAYLTTALGARGGDAGTSIVLKEGERLANLRVPLTRGSVITGVVRDQLGEPARDVSVFVSRTDLPILPSAQLGIGPPTVVTDDTGTYRIYGLAPGTYIVGAVPRPYGAFPELAVMTRAQIDAEMRLLQQRGVGSGAGIAPAASSSAAPAEKRGYAPVFHPSAIDPEQATAITVAAGEERRGVDVSIQLFPVVSISGSVIGPDGQQASRVSVELQRPMPQLPLLGGVAFNMSAPSVNGTFRFTGVLPGTYTVMAKLQAQATVPGSPSLPPGPVYLARTKIEVGGGDVSGVVLRLVPGPTMTGKIVFDATVQTPPQNLSGVRLTMTPDTDLSMFRLYLGSPQTATAIQSDGAFEIRGLTPGTYTLTPTIPAAAAPKPWLLRSVMMGDRDLLDGPLLVGDTDLSDLVVMFTDRHTEVSGTLATAAGVPVSDYVIVAMPVDRALWKSPRRVQSARPATNGQFTFTDLPPGDYLMATLTDIQENWKTAEFLGSIAASGVKLSIGEGEKKIFNLQIAK